MFGLEVDGHRVGRNQHVEFAETVAFDATIESCGEIAGFGVDLLHEARVTVVDLLVVTRPR